MERNMVNKDDFLYPRSRYYGQVNPENLVFNANLQEFTQKISYICSLETSGKLTPTEAYDQIKALWKQLKRTKKQLRIGEEPFKNDSEEEE
jgi:isopropylmalate/homocitrate/citramalate synthase